MLNYYLISLAFMLVPPIYYFFFRGAVDTYLRRKKVSKTRIRKLKKGKKNFWLYESLHESFDMGRLYILNKTVIILYLANLTITVVLGWLRYATPVISGLYAVLMITVSIMSLFSSIQDNLDEYDVPVVLFRIRKDNRGCDSIIFDLFFSVLPLLLAYVHISQMIEIII